MTAAALSLVGVLAASLGCEPTPPVTLTVETFNVNLSGAYGPYGDARRQPIIDAVSTIDADVLCLQEVWLQEDKEAIADAAEARFPYVAYFVHDLETEVTDPADQQGVVPSEPSEPPCGTDELDDLLERTVDCLREQCSDEPAAGDDAHLESVLCAEQRCFESVRPEFMANESSLRCYACVATGAPTESFATIRGRCSESTGPSLTFEGQSGVMVLSRHPVTTTDVDVLPSTWSRRVVLSATIDVSGYGPLEVYCAHLTPLFNSPVFPYTGNYGEGSTSFTGWEAENRFQAQRLVDWVNDREAGVATVVAGTMNAGVEVADDSGVVVVDEAAESFGILESNLDLGVALDYEPACTMCPDNPITGYTSSAVWVDHIFLRNIDRAAVRSTERTFTDAVVEIDGGATVTPLSDHYGLRSVLEL